MALALIDTDTSNSTDDTTTSDTTEQETRSTSTDPGIAEPDRTEDKSTSNQTSSEGSSTGNQSTDPGLPDPDNRTETPKGAPPDPDSGPSPNTQSEGPGAPDFDTSTETEQSTATGDPEVKPTDNELLARQPEYEYNPEAATRRDKIMGLIQKAKDQLGIGPSPEKRWQEAAEELSGAYPDTPEYTYRCAKCKEIKDVSTVGGRGLDTEDGEIITLVYCNQCSESDF